VATVAILSTGYEVLRGYTLNTNASWLARRGTECGARVTSVVTVGDGLEDLARALRAAVAEADCVLVTGGLGPTEDDRTREALALVAGVPLVEDSRARAVVDAYFRRAARSPGPVQWRQALVPKGMEPLRNAEGTAPGIAGRVGSAAVFLLPGPPREMRSLFEAEVLPRWRALATFDATAARVVWTAGVPESEVARPLEPYMRADEPTVGTHPDDGEVAVRILARGPGAEARADAVLAAAREALGDHVVSTHEDERVQHAVVALLARRGLVVTTAESVTGGLVARMLVEVPGASRVFRGGFVVYSDAWKAARLGVPQGLLDRDGAVSASVAAAMAEGALHAGPADLAVATTGVAGPGPDGRGVPEGTVFVAVAGSGRPTQVASHRFAVPRVPLQRRAAVAALDAVRRALLPGG